MRATISLCVGIGVLLIGVASPARAQELFACVSTKNGSLRIVALPSDCVTSRETAVSWNVVGPQGEPGAPGEEGPEGPQGPPGPAGSPLRVFDGDGNVLGIPHGDGLFFNEALGLSLLRSTALGENTAARPLWFAEEDCAGQAFMDLSGSDRIFVDFLIGPYPTPFAKYYVASGGGALRPLEIMSQLNTAGCSQIGGELQKVIPASPFTGTLPFAIPVPEPIHVGIAP